MDPRTSRSPDLDPRKLSRQLAEIYYLTPPPSTWFIQAFVIILYILAFLSVTVTPGLFYSIFIDLFPSLGYRLFLIGLLIGVIPAIFLIYFAQWISLILAMAVHLRQTRDMIFYLLVNDPPPKK